MKKKLLLSILATLFMCASVSTPLLFNHFDEFKEVNAATTKCEIYVNDKEYDKNTVYDVGDVVIINSIKITYTDTGQEILDKDLSLTINGVDVSGMLSAYGISGAKFTPNEVGSYKLKIKATDFNKTYTFKTALKEGTPIFNPFSFSHAAINNERYYFPHATATSTLDPNISYTRKITSVSSGQEYDVTESDENGYYFDFATHSFTGLTDNIGKFYVTIIATNSIGEAKGSEIITTKYRLRDADARANNNFFNASNWVGASFPGSNDVQLGSPSYYKGCLKLEDGLKLPLYLSGLSADYWTVLCIGQMPKDNRCSSWGGSNNDTGFYFRFYYDNDNSVIRVDIQYCDSYGGKTALSGNYYLGSLDNGYVELQMSPFNLDVYPDKYDQFEIRLNGVLFEAMGIEGCSLKDLADDEGYVYISSYSYGNARINIKNSIGIVDRNVPEIVLDSDIVSRGYMGELVTLPLASGHDEVDGVINARLTSVLSPNKEKITVINNRFILGEEGDYVVKYSSTDSCGNVGTSEYIIHSLNPSPYVPHNDDYDLTALNDVNNVPLIIIASVTAILFLGTIVLMIFIIKKRY